MISKHIIFLSLLFCHSAYPSVLLKGDALAPADATFSFPIKEYVGNIAGSYFFVGARTSNVAKEFSLSYITRHSTEFKGLAPELAKVDGVENTANPLYNSGISFMDVLVAEDGAVMVGSGLVDRPVVVTVDKPANMYLIDHFRTNSVSLLSAVDIKDALAQVTAGIVGLSATVKGRSGVFAAVKKNGGNFGDAGSGIALVQIQHIDAQEEQAKKAQGTEKTPKTLTFSQVNAFAGGTTNPRAASLYKGSDVVKIVSDLAAMANVVSLYWDSVLDRLYIGLQVESAAGATDGAQAVVVGRVSKTGKISFSSIAPVSVYTQDNLNEIVGAIGSSSAVTIHQLKTMYTSTLLSYLIVLGGNGPSASTHNTMYALPLANKMNAMGEIATVDQATHGTLASKNGEVTTQFVNNIIRRRVVRTVATTPSDIFTTDLIDDNVPALIGGGPLLAGDIDKFLISGDTVFALVSTADPNQLPGIFYSQALFDAQGRIARWTSWQRVAGTVQSVFGAGYETSLGNFTMLFGADASSINTVKRTVWGEGDSQELGPLQQTINTEFHAHEGGLQGLFDKPRNTVGLADISILIATGLEKIALIETGRLVASTFTPVAGDLFKDVQRFSDGQLTADANAIFVVIQGGQLHEIGPVVAAEIAQDGTAGTQGYLFVGGHNGLAVLSKPNGQGWDTTIELGPNFSGLTAGMAFKPVGHYHFVRKLIYDADFLYVLTDTKLDRLDLTDPTFPATTIALRKDFIPANTQGGFADLMVSDQFALLATTRGLFRIGDGHNVQVAIDPEDAAWTRVEIPEGLEAVTHLYAATKTGIAQDVARDGGLVYVLNAYQGKEQAQINRFVINKLDGQVTNQTCVPVPDMLYKDTLTGEVNFGAYRSLFVTDGALYMHAVNQNLSQQARVTTGLIKRVFTQIPLELSNMSTFAALMRSTASGSWLVAGDGSLRLNE